jgi:signal transduction histidine kinase
VYAHHGLVDARSTEGEGTEIAIALPIDAGDEQTETIDIEEE